MFGFSEYGDEYSNIHVTIQVDKMKECLFLNTNAIIKGILSIIIMNLIYFLVKLNTKKRLNQKDTYLHKF